MKGIIRVVLIHGTYGSPQENWIPWLLAELKQQGLEVSAPSFPTPEGQSLDTWRSTFEREVGQVDEATILVAHSLGAGFVLNLLEGAKHQVLGTFLVSGFVGSLGLSDFDPLNASFVEKYFDWQKIQRDAGFVRIYNGSNDPYVPLERGQFIADRLKVPLQVIKNGGHINSAAGYNTFPLLRDDVLGLVRQQQREHR